MWRLFLYIMTVGLIYGCATTSIGNISREFFIIFLPEVFYLIFLKGLFILFIIMNLNSLL